MIIFGCEPSIPSLELTYPLKIDPWKRRFLLETIIFRGELLVSGRVKAGNLTYITSKFLDMWAKIWDWPPFLQEFGKMEELQLLGVKVGFQKKRKKYIGGKGAIVVVEAGCWCYIIWYHLSQEKNPRTFHYTGCLIGILTMVDYNPHIAG